MLRSPGEVRIEVRDEGRGVPADKIAEMRSQSGGSGIGTSGMRERIEQFGNELKIDSANGHGTLVSATIPLGDVANQPNNANRPPSSGPSYCML